MSQAPKHLTIDQLKAGDPQNLADEINIPVVWCDHQVTRRQRLHGANIPGAQHAYTNTHINEVLAQVALEGFEEAIFICQTPRNKYLACFIQFSPIE